MRRLVATLLLAAAVLVPAATAAGVPPIPNVPGLWSHALINVRIGKKPHTLILDRGRVVTVSATQVVLLESDGSVATVPLSPTTIVRIDGLPGTILQLRRRMIVVTMRIDGGAAVRLRARSPILAVR